MAALCGLLIVWLTNACSFSSIPFIGKIGDPPVVNPVSEFPLTPGSYWIYSHVESAGEGIKTGRITVSVVDNQRLGSYFLAHMKVEKSFDAQRIPDWFGRGSTEFWFAIDDNGDVYRLLDPSNVENLENSHPFYKFPSERMECDRDFEVGCMNYPALEGVYTIKTPAGVIPDCYKIVTEFLSGSPVDWVCDNVGFTAGYYYHITSWTGYETNLLEYWIAPP